MTVTLPAPAPARAYSPLAIPPSEPLLTLDVLGRPLLNLVVYGEAGPQGSKKAVGTRQTKSGKFVTTMAESSVLVKPWRAKVAAAALAAMPRGWVALDGPLVMDIIVTRRRPVNAPKTLRVLPDTTPDLDKLARSTADALSTDCKSFNRPCIADDARIVEYRRLAKVYEGDSLDSDALRREGAVIRVWKYPAELLGKVGR